MLSPACAFLGAALLFGLQPIVARQVIPVLGGSPSVWTACVLFFSTVLLLGYLYAHALGRIGSLRIQAFVHVTLLLSAAALLPARLADAATFTPLESSPTRWLLVMLARTVGPAAFVISATGPLVQAWLVRTRRVDPYHVYAFGNAGSLAALVAYPLIVEPVSSLTQQFTAWKWGCWSFVAAMSSCAVLAARSTPANVADRNASSVPWDARANETLATALLWVALSAIPSSLMLGVTAYLSTDIAAVPLLWVVPCALYLLTLIASFSRFLPHVTAFSGFLLPIAVPASLAVQSAHAPTPALLFAALQLAAFVVAALACHGALAVRRPSPDRLTVFYLWIAIGGVLGGAVNTLVAPALFSTVLEYPLMLIAALVLPTWCAAQRPWQAWGRYAAFIGVASVPSALLLQAMDVSRALVLFVAVGIPLAFCFASRHAGVQAGVIVALIVTPFLAGNRQEKVLYTARSFFGVHKVIAVDDGAAHILQHGTTVHGRQSLANELRREPASYYQHGGPFGDIDRLSVAGRGRRVGVAGLGTGTLAAYARPGDEWTFFEIDPTVERIARNPAFFTYLGDCGGRCRVILGDARISIRAAPARSFDLLVFDVFSSDAIPVHLLTQEAIAESTERLRPGGLIAFHISNRYLHLPPVLAAGAAANQWSAVVRNHTADPDDRSRGGLSSDWVVAANSEATLAPFVTLGWRPLADNEPRVAAWTDDYSNVLAVARWRRSSQ